MPARRLARTGTRGNRSIGSPIENPRGSLVREPAGAACTAACGRAACARARGAARTAAHEDGPYSKQPVRSARTAAHRGGSNENPLVQLEREHAEAARARARGAARTAHAASARKGPAAWGTGSRGPGSRTPGTQVPSLAPGPALFALDAYSCSGRMPPHRPPPSAC